jgi:hypothetical protein
MSSSAKANKGENSKDSKKSVEVKTQLVRTGWGTSGKRPEIDPVPRGYPEIGARVTIFDCNQEFAYTDFTVMRPIGITKLDKSEEWVCLDTSDIPAYMDSGKSGTKILNEYRGELRRDVEIKIGVTVQVDLPDKGKGKKETRYSPQLEKVVRLMGKRSKADMIECFPALVHKKSPFYERPLSMHPELDYDSPEKKVGNLLENTAAFFIECRAEMPNRAEFDKRLAAAIHQDYEASAAVREYNTELKAYEKTPQTERKKEGIKKPKPPTRPNWLDLIPAQMRKAHFEVEKILRVDLSEHHLSKEMITRKMARETVIPSTGRAPMHLAPFTGFEKTQIPAELTSLVSTGELRAKLEANSEAGSDLIEKLGLVPKDFEHEVETISEPDPGPKKTQPTEIDEDESDEEEETPELISAITCHPDLLKKASWSKDSGISLTKFLRDATLSCGDVATYHAEVLDGTVFQIEDQGYDLEYPETDGGYPAFKPILTAEGASMARASNSTFHQMFMQALELWCVQKSDVLDEQGYAAIKAASWARLNLANSRCVPLSLMWEFDTDYADWGVTTPMQDMTAWQN